MKIGILTQPLRYNYGGLLQAYALQSVLKSLGHEVWILQREKERHAFLLWLKNLLFNLGRIVLGKSLKKWLYRRTEQRIWRNTLDFSACNIIPKSPVLTSTAALKRYWLSNHFEACVVGSDQVWRPKYSPNIYNYYCDFLDDDRFSRISYAASFGVEDWEYSQEESQRCRELISRFRAVSVREESGITLCKEHFCIDAVHVLDPTLLLDAQQYRDLVGTGANSVDKGKLFSYLLDETQAKRDTLKNVSSATGLCPFTTMPVQDACNISERVFPPVTDWIRAFDDAEMIVTDSFHGCVFSIIFNKPFWVVLNRKRGAARIESLLNQFSLQDRLVAEGGMPSRVDAEIDWDRVNARKNELKQASMNFLSDNLK